MKISEIFYSIQGEGLHQGLPMVFVRVQGCNLAERYGGCKWCDTRYAQPSAGGEQQTLAQIMDRISRYPCRRICVTGGEPLAAPEIGPLLRLLKNDGFWIEVETNGSLAVGNLLPQADSWVVDVKCPSSGMEQHNLYSELPRLRHRDQVKFVAADDTDIAFARGVLAAHRTPAGILFSPAYGSQDWLPALAEHVKLIDGARLSLQMHKYVWGEVPGK